ncbi:hypothetical protein HYALB_00004347 [Hymenoscyphus albidus]|uniref:BTB domain-containing protein n=1 Tax=Hymenoscyphus albidus TaxID=595503 RepID=A0A9N9M3I7_9HELO|nr:hypothetical protein HYALB_00004347 [Hymenoscyphus albidus]
MDEADRCASSDVNMASATKTGSTQSSEGAPESDTNISATSPSPFQTLLLDYKEEIEGPYDSSQVKLIVGPQENQHTLYAHKNALCSVAYFKACLREDAFIEGQTNTIVLPEEDPLVFRRLLEWMYTKSCFPVWDSEHEISPRLAPPPYIQRLAHNVESELYLGSYKQFGAIANGSSTSTDETFALFQVIVLTMCAAERYCMLDLQQHCMWKLKKFPIGAKEVAVLAQHILTNIPPSRKEIYDQLQDFINCHLTRLSDCPFVDAFLQNEASEPARELFKMVNFAGTSGVAKKIEAVLDGKLEAPTAVKGIALCIRDVNVQDLINKYGSDYPDRFAVKFGSAKAGDIFITDGEKDNRGIIRCWQGMNFLGDNGKPQKQASVAYPAAYPAEYFRLLHGGEFS